MLTYGASPPPCPASLTHFLPPTDSDCIRQHTSGSIRQHTSAYVSIRQHPSQSDSLLLPPAPPPLSPTPTALTSSPSPPPFSHLLSPTPPPSLHPLSHFLSQSHTERLRPPLSHFLPLSLQTDPLLRTSSLSLCSPTLSHFLRLSLQTDPLFRTSSLCLCSPPLSHCLPQSQSLQRLICTLILLLLLLILLLLLLEPSRSPAHSPTPSLCQRCLRLNQRICLFSGLRPDEVYKKKGNQKKMRQQHTTYIYTANLLDFGSSATGTEHKTIFFVSISFFAYVNVVNAFVRTYSAHALKRQYLRPQKRGAPHFIRAGV
jgi:hypothetical protein